MTLHPPGDVPWTVHNYDNEAFGKLNIVDATVNSVNTVYAQLMLAVGPQYAVSLAERLGLPSTLGAYPSEVLGDNDVHPLDVADAYATFAADGVHTAPVFVTKVTDRNGNVVYTDHTPHKQVLDPQIARTVNHTLEQVVSRGTGVNARIGRPVAGKTGTTDNYDDAWFVGSTPQLTTAVWVGSGSTPYAMLPPRTARRSPVERGRPRSGSATRRKCWATCRSSTSPNRRKQPGKASCRRTRCPTSWACPRARLRRRCTTTATT